VIRSVIAHNSATEPSQNAGGIEGEPGATQNEVISISRSRIVDNHAGGNGGGVYAYNRLTINRSILRGNTAGVQGGAIYNFGKATIARSTIAGNRATTNVGGGIHHAEGTLIVRSSTLNGNVAASNDGGAIENYDTAVLVNDTITKNRAGGNGGGIDADGIATSLNGVTIARNSATGNGGGVHEEGTPFTMRNSLVALNSTTSGLGPDCYSAVTPSAGHNLIGDTAGCAGIFGPATNDFTNLNPRIAQLADNGGPTKTIALGRRSKAIDHAGGKAPTRDQRGAKRHDPDIGAFERR
jgi:predicted outer membrane repeat protein